MTCRAQGKDTDNICTFPVAIVVATSSHWEVGSGR
jgi:hypothetical protein